MAVGSKKWARKVPSFSVAGGIRRKAKKHLSSVSPVLPSQPPSLIGVDLPELIRTAAHAEELARMEADAALERELAASVNSNEVGAAAGRPTIIHDMEDPLEGIDQEEFVNKLITDRQALEGGVFDMLQQELSMQEAVGIAARRLALLLPTQNVEVAVEAMKVRVHHLYTIRFVQWLCEKIGINGPTEALILETVISRTLNPDPDTKKTAREVDPTAKAFMGILQSFDRKISSINERMDHMPPTAQPKAAPLFTRDPFRG